MCFKSPSSRSSYIVIICPLLGNTPPHACVLSHFSYARLCDPMDCNPPGSSVHGILQVRILEWVAMPSFRGLLNAGIEPASPASPAVQVDCLLTEPLGKPNTPPRHWPKQVTWTVLISLDYSYVIFPKGV